LGRGRRPHQLLLQLRTTMRQRLLLLISLAIAAAACGPSSHGGPDDASSMVIDAFVPPPDATPAGFGMPCSTASDCPTGLCVSGTDHNYCTTTCTENCPAGFGCRVTEVNGT